MQSLSFFSISLYNNEDFHPWSPAKVIIGSNTVTEDTDPFETRTP